MVTGGRETYHSYEPPAGEVLATSSDGTSWVGTGERYTVYNRDNDGHIIGSTRYEVCRPVRPRH